ncbi:MAG: hypothetical protein ACRBC3_14035 [Burkholderiaceae bacterium]
MKQFRAIEHFQPGRLDGISKRFDQKAGRLPERLNDPDRWLPGDGRRRFQLVQTAPPPVVRGLATFLLVTSSS